MSTHDEYLLAFVSEAWYLGIGVGINYGSHVSMKQVGSLEDKLQMEVTIPSSGRVSDSYSMCHHQK